jgi:RNA polymerase sigma-B factor
VRPPRDLQELALRAEHVANELSTSLGRAPSVAELAAALDRTDEDVLEALEAGRSRNATSLSTPRGGEEDGLTLGDTLGKDEDGFDRVDDRATVATLLEALAPREQEVLRLRFREDLTQAEIGKIIGVSQMQVSRIIRGAIQQLSDRAGRSRL